ncbi:MAG: glycosyltransferase family 4 protein [Thermoanaerobaculia bacterium]
MRISYLLEGTELFGGVKVALHQANLLAARGHRVRIFAKGEPPEWFPVRGEFHRVEAFDGLELGPEEVCVATFWTTLTPAVASGAAPLHYCQGFEASYTHNHAEHPAIEAAYRMRVPAMTVSPHLAELVERRFGRPARTVTQPIEGCFRPDERPRGPSPETRILVMGPWEIDWKGVETALRAVTRLRDSGVPCRLVRVSQWPVAAPERALLAPDEAHVHLDPPEVAALMRGCDLLLAPSWEQEGFGLPVLEAMASGMPVVASDVASFRAFSGGAAVLVPPRDPEAFAAAAAALLADPEAWRRRRLAGLKVARRFSEDRAARDAEAAAAWALGRPAG